MMTKYITPEWEQKQGDDCTENSLFYSSSLDKSCSKEWNKRRNRKLSHITDKPDHEIGSLLAKTPQTRKEHYIHFILYVVEIQSWTMIETILQFSYYRESNSKGLLLTIVRYKTNSMLLICNIFIPPIFPSYPSLLLLLINMLLKYLSKFLFSMNYWFVHKVFQLETQMALYKQSISRCRANTLSKMVTRTNASKVGMCRSRVMLGEMVSVCCIVITQTQWYL